MKKLVLFICFFFITSSQSFAIDSRVENVFGDFLKKLETRYSLSQREIVLTSLRDKVSSFKNQEKYKNLISVLSDISTLNNEALYKIWLEKNLAHTDQQILEIKQRKVLKSNTINPSLPSSVSSLIGADREYIETNGEREFVKDGDIYKVDYSTYFPITVSNFLTLKSKSGIIVPGDGGEYRFVESYSFDKKIPYSELDNFFDIYITDKHRVIQKSDGYHGYNFTNFRFYEDKYGVYESQLKNSGFDYKTTLLYKNEQGSYNFIVEYDDYRIAKIQDILGVPEKHLFLDYLREDAKFQTADISGELAKIKNISKTLTEGKTPDQSIGAIYDWILSNVSYSQNIDLSDEKIFSGIETFKNGEGVCTGYTKLSSYLFYFAGHYDVEVIRGNVIDAEDFPEIGHAWLRIGDLYYDPTFDDPIGAQDTKSKDQYKYFGLPRDIFYANRFEYGDMPEAFKTASAAQIDQHIFNTLSNLIPKYQSQLDLYPVFAPVQFKKTYNISAGTIITPELLASKIGSYNVDSETLKFTQNGDEKSITSLRYYPLTTKNTQAVLDIFNYKTDNLYLFNWGSSTSNPDWRLAYDLKTR